SYARRKQLPFSLLVLAMTVVATATALTSRASVMILDPTLLFVLFSASLSFLGVLFFPRRRPSLRFRRLSYCSLAAFLLSYAILLHILISLVAVDIIAIRSPAAPILPLFPLSLPVLPVVDNGTSRGDLF
ncbi:unnamed protein product, partial [Ectocarpus fasciculatus]